MVRDELVGVLNISSRAPNTIYVEEDLRALEVFAENAGTCIRQAERAEWMRQTIDRMHRQSSREQEPVTAVPPSRLYLARKFVRRHRVAVTAGALVVAALLTWPWLRLGRMRSEATLLAFAAAFDIKVTWMAKHSLFFPPLGWVLRAMGGMPIVRHQNQNVVDAMVEEGNARGAPDNLTVAFLLVETPELT